MKKKCYTCEYFHIRQQPLRGKEGLYDMGMAECTKHNLVVDFVNHGKLKRLECVEESEGEE